MTSCDLKNITTLTRIHLKEKIEKGQLGGDNKDFGENARVGLNGN